MSLATWKLRRSTRILLVGLCLALLVLTAGAVNTRRLEHQERAAVATCEAENRVSGSHFVADSSLKLWVSLPWAEAAADPNFKALSPGARESVRQEYFEQHVRPQIPHGTDPNAVKAHFDQQTRSQPWALDPLVCDAAALVSDGAKLIGIQAKIVDAHRASGASRAWPLPAALALFCLAALPWLWYALLRRIGELRAAIGGRPPES